MAATASPRAARGDRALTPDWMNDTHKLLTTAADQKSKSTQLRETSTVLKANMQKETRSKATDVNNLLREKVQETNTLKTRLEKCLYDLQAETQNLINARDYTQQTLDARAQPLKVAEKQIQIRKNRPQRESINDTVERALHAQICSLQDSIDELRGGINKADDQIARMEKCSYALAADVEDKRHALELDQECLGVVGNGGSLTNLPDPKSATVVNTKRSKTVPEQWRSNSKRTMDASVEMIGQSIHLCKNLRKSCKQCCLRNDKAAQDVQMSLGTKVKQTGKLRGDLTRRLNEVNNEISQLTAQREEVTNSIEEQSNPLSVLKQRLAIRKKRPSRETVRDKVEEAMEQEMHKLSTAVAELHKKQQNIDRQLKGLYDLQKQLHEDLSDKTAGLNLDNSCAYLRPDNMSMASDRQSLRSSQGSVAGSDWSGSGSRSPRIHSSQSPRGGRGLVTNHGQV